MALSPEAHVHVTKPPAACSRQADQTYSGLWERKPCYCSPQGPVQCKTTGGDSRDARTAGTQSGQGAFNLPKQVPLRGLAAGVADSAKVARRGRSAFVRGVLARAAADTESETSPDGAVGLTGPSRRPAALYLQPLSSRPAAGPGQDAKIRRHHLPHAAWTATRYPAKTSVIRAGHERRRLQTGAEFRSHGLHQARELAAKSWSEPVQFRPWGFTANTFDSGSRQVRSSAANPTYRIARPRVVTRGMSWATTKFMPGPVAGPGKPTGICPSAARPRATNPLRSREPMRRGTNGDDTGSHEDARFDSELGHSL